MSLEGVDGLFRGEFADVDVLVGGARGERLVVLPVHVEGWCWRGGGGEKRV